MDADDIRTGIRNTIARVRERVQTYRDDRLGDDLQTGRDGVSAVVAIVTSTRAQLAYAAVAGIGIGVALLAAAFSLYGLWSGIAVGAGLVIGLSAPWAYVRVMLTPLGKTAFGAGFFVLAQLAFDAGALVCRDDGVFEWVKLREDEAGLFGLVGDGRRVDIDVERATLPKVAWAPLAVVEEKTDSNMSRFTVDETFETARPDPTGGTGEVVQTPLALADGGEGWHLDAAKLERWARGSAGAELPRNGRRKALEEEGGEQRVSQLVTMIGAGLLVVVGFGMTVGALLI